MRTGLLAFSRGDPGAVNRGDVKPTQASRSSVDLYRHNILQNIGVSGGEPVLNCLASLVFLAGVNWRCDHLQLT